MEVASLLVAALGVLLGALSLGWQAATFVLTGGRVKATLKLGALADDGTGMGLGEIDKITPEWFERAARQGFSRPIIAIVVRNVGRLPVTVNRWSLETEVGASLSPMANSIGPDLPHRLDNGESATWATDLSHARALALAAGEALAGGQKPPAVVGAVELGDGRTRSTAKSFRPSP